MGIVFPNVQNGESENILHIIRDEINKPLKNMKNSSNSPGDNEINIKI